MKIYDLSQELFSSKVFPGDPAPQKEALVTISDTAAYNLTKITMGSHNGTHMDAPLHFCKGGKSIDQVDLSACIGDCKVILHNGDLTAANVQALLADGTKRLLLKGAPVITTDAAQKMVQMGLLFLGVESFTVGAMDAPAPVHLILLGAEVVVLEAAVLSDVPDGNYFLVSAPLKYGGVDGAQCRPVLLSF